jgi:hypothetical protein
MKFFFADSLDVVDPSFDFRSETRSPHRVRQRDDLYPHEIFAVPPYDGLLVSKAIVDGTAGGASGKYSMAQRQRLLRQGARNFFRLDERLGSHSLKTMGDCGAFTYIRDDVPPYSVDEVIAFYESCGFDYGVSVDHVILAFQPDTDGQLPGMICVDEGWSRRQKITLELARDFLQSHRKRRCRFVPIGVAQGWSPASYRHAVSELQTMGYDHLALGGLVPLKTAEILEVLEAVSDVLRPGVGLHLFGVTRCDYIGRFADFGVTSFDSTSPLRQAFKDDRDNYYTPTTTYSAIRVPQTDGNAKLKRKLLSGVVSHPDARRLERECLQILDRFDQGVATADEALGLLAQYELIHDGRTTRADVYREVMRDKPWKECPCEVCRALGIQVMVFRGSERNRRRGFHNLYVFFQRLQAEMAKRASTNGPRRAAACREV